MHDQNKWRQRGTAAVAAAKRKGADARWTDVDRSGVRQRRSHQWHFSFGVLDSRLRSMRNLPRTKSGSQEVTYAMRHPWHYLMEDSTRVKLQKYAKENCFMLVFMSLGFALTITTVILVGVWAVAHGQ